MEAQRVHRALRDLIEKAVSEMENTAIECNEIAEQLENGELLAGSRQSRRSKDGKVTGTPHSP